MGEAVFLGYLEDHTTFNDGLSGLKMHIHGSLPSLAESPVAPEDWLVSGRAVSCRASPVCPAATMLNPQCVHQEHRCAAPILLPRHRESPGPLSTLQGTRPEETLSAGASGCC